jgi:hypothetical protein
MPTGLSKRFVAKNGLDNNSKTIVNLADPVNSQDAATRSYVLTTTSNILPSQAGNQGKFLTTDGSVVSWTTISGSGTVTSVDISGGTTGLTTTGGPVTSSGTITLGGTLAVANGGTGATTADDARINLSAAKSGANSDITSITGLTTALSIAQGGTGATTAGAARTALSAAASGANSDITSITGLTTALSIAQGGTGAATASAAINALVPSQTGNSGRFLTTNGTAVSWAESTSGAAGSNTQVQYNSNGALAGSSRFVYNGTTTMTLGAPNTTFNIIGSPYITNADTGSNLLLQAGAGGTAFNQGTQGGSVTIAGGDGAVSSAGGATGGGGNLTLRSGLGITSGGSIFLSTGTTSAIERLRIISNGAWGLSGANYGTAGQVLSSNGSSSPPTWITPVGTNPAGSTGQLQYNNANAFGATAQMSYNGTNILTIGSIDSTFTIRGAPFINTTSYGANLVIQAGAGNTSFGSQGTTAGNMTLAGGDAGTGGAGGDLTIRPGFGTARPGTFYIQTGASSASERLRITSAGAWGLGGANYGTSGQVLTSNGSASAPTWQGISLSSASGTLAIANGGTGATTASAAINALLPSQTGNTGKYLSTDGAGTLSWQATSSGLVAPNYEEIAITATQTVVNTTVNTVAKASGKAYLQVFLNGVLQMEGSTKAFTVTGANQITFNLALSADDDLAIFSFA